MKSVDRKNQHVFTPFCLAWLIYTMVYNYIDKCTDDDNSHYHWFQFTYTSMFGKLSEVIYSATDQNLWSCIVLHMICNIFGLPNF